MGAITFAEIVDISKWQEIQDHFATVLGITLVTLDTNRRYLTSVSMPDNLHKEVVTASMITLARCGEFVAKNPGSITGNWKEGVKCPGGFYSFYIPIELHSQVCAYWLLGPVVVGRRPDEETLINEAREININLELFVNAAREIKAFSFYGIKSIVEFLCDIATYIIKLGYQNIHLKHIAPELVGAFDRVYGFHVERLLNALLDVSFSFTSAGRGSLMLFDPAHNELYIHKAKGLAKDVVEKTRLKLGESIAGIAAQERKPLYIDKDTRDQRITGFLNHPEIKSAVSYPIEVGDSLLGVLNIASYSEGGADFFPKSRTTITNLIKLIETTLRDLPRSQFT